VADKTPTPSLYEQLVAQLRSQTNTTDLFRLATSDDFKGEAASLPPADLKGLRDVYNGLRTEMDGKVRLDTFDGQIVYIVGIDYWHSENSFGRQTDGTNGVTLHIRPENSEKEYRALTSSAPVLQFCETIGRGRPPTTDEPVRVMLNLVPVTDAKRAREGQKKWQIKRLPMPQERNTDGAPF
jgi:hypothetical protein